jgi:hypothetical protein
VSRLTTKSRLVAPLYAQLAGAASLREIETGLNSHAARLYHLGAHPARRSTLADANARRPAAVFAELLALLMRQAQRGLRRQLAVTVHLIDATSLRLDQRSAGWARFSAGVCGAKVHVIDDPDTDRPIYAAVSAAKLNDITAAQRMPIEPGATYVFDLGYDDYGWWATLDAARCRIVTRFKSNTPLTLKNGRCRKAAIFSPTASASCRRAKPRAAATRCRRRCARSASAPRRGRCCASSRTTSTPLPRRSPLSTSGAGRSSSSSSG